MKPILLDRLWPSGFESRPLAFSWWFLIVPPLAPKFAPRPDYVNFSQETEEVSEFLREYTLTPELIPGCRVHSDTAFVCRPDISIDAALRAEAGVGSIDAISASVLALTIEGSATG